MVPLKAMATTPVTPYRMTGKYSNKSVFQHWFKEGCRIPIVNRLHASVCTRARSSKTTFRRSTWHHLAKLHFVYCNSSTLTTSVLLNTSSKCSATLETMNIFRIHFSSYRGHGVRPLLWLNLSRNWGTIHDANSDFWGVWRSAEAVVSSDFVFKMK